MIEPNNASFLSPRDRIRFLAKQSLETSDKNHLEPKYYPRGLSAVFLAIKAYYLSMGNDLDHWQKVTQNPQEFNRAWCGMLGIKYEGKPPALIFRSRTVNINQSN